MSALGALTEACVVVALLSPAALLGLLGGASLVRKPLGEGAITFAVRAAMLTAFAAAAAALLIYLGTGAEPRVISTGVWFAAGSAEFTFDFLLDGISLGFGTLTMAVCGVTAAFSLRYLHQEPGHNRYFVLFALFVTGMALVAFAGSIEVLFAGWELLGLSSALLVGFFHERRAPVNNALRVFAVYRVSDAAMLAAAVLLHHFAGSGSLSLLFSGHGASGAALGAEQTTLIAILLLAAVAGKSALFPFSGWLPRAMEGPTPSSAVYYGALSIHAGCLLLLRAEPLLAQSAVASTVALLAGASTAVYAAFVGRVQTDVKSALALAALTQVGIIVVEIALGLTTLAFLHIIGHVCFRLLQFLSAPNILHDLHALQDGLGASTAAGAAPAGRLHRRLYLLALERGFVDAALDRLVVAPFAVLAARLDGVDRLLCGNRRGDDGRAP